MTRNRSIRRGITLVELMVAMAITLVIMLVLGEGFKGTLDFVRASNALGGMIYQLNGAGAVMTRDLTKAEHFAPDDRPGVPNRGVHLSDQRLDWFNVPGKNWRTPRGGFFRIYSPPPSREAFFDQEGFQITWAENHQLHFTSVLPGGSDQNLFTVRTAAGTFSSPAAEIAYFLSSPTGTTGPGGRNLCNLHRRYRLVAMDDAVANFPATINTPDDEVLSRNAVSPPNGINTLATVADPRNRMPLLPLAGNRFGEDILLSNVLSFEVLADWTQHPTLAGSTTPPTAFATNSDAPWDYLTQPGSGPNAHVFDTAPMPPATNVPQYVRIKSLRVVVRVWDPRMKMARQNTWYFYM
jgi:hypothetical protein